MDAEIAALTRLTSKDLTDILNCVGPNGLVQSSPNFKDAKMVNISILFLAVGIPLLIVSAMAISMYNTYIVSEEKEEEKKTFANLNSAQIFFLVLSILSILVGVTLLSINLARRSKVELQVITNRAKQIAGAQPLKL